MAAKDAGRQATTPWPDLPAPSRRSSWLAALRGFIGGGPFVLTSLVVAVTLAIAAILTSIDTRYQVVFPGPVTDVQGLIEPFPKPKKGALYLTTIYSDPANAAEWAAVSLYSKLRADAALVPREESRPRNVTEKEYQKLLVTMMDESKVAAKVVALREAGYDVKVTGQGAQVQEVTSASAARGVLEPGDIIVEADGRAVTTSNDLVALIQSHKPGETIRLRVRRGDAERVLDVTLTESPDEPGRSRVGIIVLTHLYEYQLPKELNLKTRDVGGPSGGLMFALGIYNSVSADDITRGHKIAGTGSISTDGRVGAVGGVKYKVIAAERAGSELFLAPQESLEEARAHAGKMRVVPVKTFKEALDALATLAPK